MIIPSAKPGKAYTLSSDVRAAQWSGSLRRRPARGRTWAVAAYCGPRPARPTTSTWRGRAAAFMHELSVHPRRRHN